jgi:hypothetical protein
MEKYFVSFRNKDEASIKSLVSPKYFKMLKANGTLANSFKMQDNTRPIEKLDYKVIKSASVNSRFLVNTKRKIEKEFDHYWYTVEVKKEKLKITDMIMLEEHPH